MRFIDLAIECTHHIFSAVPMLMCPTTSKPSREPLFLSKMNTITLTRQLLDVPTEVKNKHRL